MLKTADLIDKFGAKGARRDLSIKVAAPRVALNVIDRAIELHGGAGVRGDDTPLAGDYAHARTLRIVDGPDAVHIRGVAKEELARDASLQRLRGDARTGPWRPSAAVQQRNATGSQIRSRRRSLRPPLEASSGHHRPRASGVESEGTTTAFEAFVAARWADLLPPPCC